MHFLFKGKIFRRSQRHFGRCDTLDCRVVCQIDKKYGSVESTRFPEGFDKIVGFLKGNSHSRENNGEFFIIGTHLCLSGDLRRKVCVRKSRGRKYGKLLSSDKGVQSVDGRNAGLNKLVWILSRGGIYGTSVDVKTHFRNYFGASVNGISQTVKYPSQHILRNAEFHLAAGKAHLAVGKVYSGGRFKKLNKRVCAVDFKHSAASYLAVFKLDFAKFVIFNAFHVPYKHKGAGHFFYCSVFLRHLPLPPLRFAQFVPQVFRSPFYTRLQRPLP